MSLDVDKATAEALAAAAKNNAAAAQSAETLAKLVKDADALATKAYVDEGDAETLASAKAYVDGLVGDINAALAAI